MAKAGSVTLMGDAAHPRRYEVRSSNGSKAYTVDLDDKTCDCPDNLKGYTCKHRVAAYYFEQASTHTPKPATVAEPKPSEAVVKPESKLSPTSSNGYAPKHQSPVVEQPSPIVAPAAKRTEADILKELGFDSPAQPKPLNQYQPKHEPQVRTMPDEKKVKESGYTLGSLYQRYLHGTDLLGEMFTVTIQDITVEKVMPHPSQPQVEKWCLLVSGLPIGMPHRILFGARGEEDLVAIFGKVSVELLRGKAIMIYPKPTSVAGQQKVSIRFRSAK